MREQNRGGNRRSLILAVVAAYTTGMLIMLTQMIVTVWPMLSRIQ